MRRVCSRRKGTRQVDTSCRLGPGWRMIMTSAMSGGRDVSVAPLELKDADVTDVVITMSNEPPPQLSGTVRRTGAASPLLATVLIFPEDHEAWVRDGMSAEADADASRHRRRARTTSRRHLPGNLLIAAVDDTDVGDVQDPTLLRGALARGLSSDYRARGRSRRWISRS